MKPLVKKDCGKHFGPVAGPCAKCGHFTQLATAPKYAKYRKGLQRDGTPWIAILSPIEADAEECIDRASHGDDFGMSQGDF